MIIGIYASCRIYVVPPKEYQCHCINNLYGAEVHLLNVKIRQLRNAVDVLAGGAVLVTVLDNPNKGEHTR